MDAVQSKSIGSAALRALAAWFFLYTVASQVLVLWRWGSLVEMPSEIENGTSSHKTPNLASVEIVANGILETVPTPAERSNVSDVMNQLVKELQGVEARHQHLISETQRKLTLLRHNLQVKPVLANKESATTPQVASLQALLSLSSLSQMSEDSLKTLFQKAITELQSMASQKATIGWVEIGPVLTATYSRTVDDRDSEKECNNPSISLASSDDNHHPSLARESHLFQSVQQSETALTRLQESPRLLLENPTHVLQALERELTKALGSQSDGDTNESTQPDRVCVSHEQVVGMVDEGLNALQRRLDVQDALRQLVLALDDNATGLILDAFLSHTATEASSTRMNADKVNLRHVLDTPLLHQTAKWLDVLVDHIGGYNDFLDQSIDSLLVAEAMEHYNDTVGQILVSKLLKFVGRLELTNIATKIPTKAGMLR